MINVMRTLDAGICIEILTNEDIFKDISEDGATFNDLKIDVIKDTWLSICTETELIGCIQFKSKYSKCYESHIHILPEYRKEHSKNAGIEIIKWCEKELSGSVLYTEVPAMCKNVIRYLESFGFSHAGTLKDVFLKNDIQNDIVVMTKGV